MVDGAGVADPQHLLALGLEHLPAQAPVGLVRASAGPCGSRPAAPRPGASGVVRRPGAGPTICGGVLSSVSRSSSSLPLETACSRTEAVCRASSRGSGPWTSSARASCGQGQTLDQQRADHHRQGDEDEHLAVGRVRGEQEHGRQGDHPAHTGPGQHDRRCARTHRPAQPGRQLQDHPEREDPDRTQQDHGEEHRHGDEDRAGQPERGVDDALDDEVRLEADDRKTAFSSRYWIVVQLIRSASRDWAVWISGALWPSRTPAMTTARTPEAWMSSAGR